MRNRLFFAFVLLASLLSLCACGKTPQALPLSPFSADVSYTRDGVSFSGVFTLENGQTMRLLLREPAELQGLCFVFEGETAALRLGDAALSLPDAESLSLPAAAEHALFEALSALCAAPTPLSAEHTAEVSTARGTATVTFTPELSRPQTVDVGGVQFVFAQNFPVG